MKEKIETQELLENYYKWLKDKTGWESLKEDLAVITTPYLDRHNDYIQIYLYKEGGNYILSDDSWTIEDLEHSGCILDSDRRQDFLSMILSGFGVKKNKNEIYVKTNLEKFAMAKHNLIQAILAVNDMFYLSRQNTVALFHEDVQIWLDACEIRYSERMTILGQSGYLRHFDFIIPKSRNAPERMIQTVNRPNKSKATSIIGDWFDIREVRASDARGYTIINDNEKNIPENFQDALRNYQITPILWSQRENYKEELSA